MNDQPIAVNVEKRNDAVIVSPDGDIDLHRSPALRDHIRRAVDGRPKRLIVDLQRVPYMDSSGLATLVEAMQLTRRQSTSLVICGLQPRVKSIFEIARLESVFTIAADVDAACSK